MNFALIMNDNSYPGREYLKSLSEIQNLTLDLILIGRYPEFNLKEEIRCGGKWNPPSQSIYFDRFKKYTFESLKSEELKIHLQSKNYSLGIQGGTGILKKDIICLFKYGILNFHPGDLPDFKGCSAPEWQLLENKPIICTCHLINEGIDEGDIIEKQELDVNMKNYHEFRSSIYPEIGKFVLDTIEYLNRYKNFKHKPEAQNPNSGKYRKSVTQEEIRTIEKLLNYASY
jgi:methionyl-tRNA formyltransferase